MTAFLEAHSVALSKRQLDAQNAAAQRVTAWHYGGDPTKRVRPSNTAHDYLALTACQIRIATLADGHPGMEPASVAICQRAAIERALAFLLMAADQIGFEDAGMADEVFEVVAAEIDDGARIPG